MSVVDYDPYDLTGAARMRASVLESGATEEQADRLAELTAHRYAEGTVRTLTRDLRPYLEWARERNLVAVPAQMSTTALYLDAVMTKGRAWDGQPLSASTIDKIRYAIGRLHTSMGFDDPFALFPGLVDIIAGYKRLYERPQTQAHAVLHADLASLINATRSDAVVSLRDAVVLTVLTDPEVGMKYDQATRWLWEHIVFGDPRDPESPTRVVIPFASRPGFQELLIPDRLAAVDFATQTFLGDEMPLQARLCGTASLRSLASSRLAAGLPLSGPVLTGPKGKALSRVALIKIVQKTATEAGLSYQPTFGFDDRAALIAATEEPSLLALRDAAIMAMMWWPSLRRSECSALNVGDIGKDARGRGLVILVRKSKTSNQGQFVAVPYAQDESGTPWVTDLRTALHAYLDAYVRHVGRPLTNDDPLFISTAGAPARLGPKSIGDVIKRWAGAAGIQAELGERISSHGFRAGYATEWLRSNRPAEPLARRQRRKSTQSLLGYFRLADPFEESLSFVLEAPDGAQFDLAAYTGRKRHRQP